MIGKLSDPSVYKTLLSQAADDVCLAVYEYSYITGGSLVKAATELLAEGMDDWWDCPQKNDPPTLDYKVEYLTLVQWCLTKISRGGMDEINTIPPPTRINK